MRTIFTVVWFDGREGVSPRAMAAMAAMAAKAWR